MIFLLSAVCLYILFCSDCKVSRCIKQIKSTPKKVVLIFMMVACIAIFPLAVIMIALPLWIFDDIF